MAVAPVAAMGVSALTTWLKHRADKSAETKRLQEQRGFLAPTALETSQEQAGAATGSNLRNEGRALLGAGTQATGDVLGYYRSLARGNGAALDAAVAPERSAITSAYKGAASSLERGAPGPMRDKALADLRTQQAGKLADMTLQARRDAMGSYAGVASNAVGQGAGTSASGADIASGIAGRQLANRQLGLGVGLSNEQLRQNNSRLAFEQGSSFGKSIFDILSQQGSGGGKKGKAPSTAGWGGLGAG